MPIIRIHMSASKTIGTGNVFSGNVLSA
jgi:hypothetical protein